MQGVVRLQETGEAGAGAQVLLVVIDPEAIEFIAETQSDGTGFSQFPGVPPDAYTLLADALDFFVGFVGVADVSVTAGQTVEQDRALQR